MFWSWASDLSQASSLLQVKSTSTHVHVPTSLHTNTLHTHAHTRITMQVHTCIPHICADYSHMYIQAYTQTYHTLISTHVHTSTPHFPHRCTCIHHTQAHTYIHTVNTHVHAHSHMDAYTPRGACEYAKHSTVHKAHACPTHTQVPNTCACAVHCQLGTRPLCLGRLPLSLGTVAPSWAPLRDPQSPAELCAVAALTRQTRTYVVIANATLVYFSINKPLLPQTLCVFLESSGITAECSILRTHSFLSLSKNKTHYTFPLTSCRSDL